MENFKLKIEELISKYGIKSIDEYIHNRKFDVEKFIEDIFTGLRPYSNENYPNIVNYTKDDLELNDFEYRKDENVLYCDYPRFWKIIEYNSLLSEEEIQNLLDKIAEKHLGIKGIITAYWN